MPETIVPRTGYLERTSAEKTGDDACDYGSDKTACDSYREMVLIDTRRTECEGEGEGDCTDGDTRGHVVDEVFLVVTFELISEDLRVMCEEWSSLLSHICTYFFIIKKNSVILPRIYCAYSV